jgi:hypothetical protein
MSAVLDHARQNVVAYIALFVALGGTGYAAMTLPRGSVGERQIKNHAIDPIKFDPRFINGSVRAWAVVASSGRLIAGAGRPEAEETIVPANYVITWGTKLKQTCATIATIDGNHSPPTENIPIPGNPSVPFTAGYAVADSFSNGNGRGHNGTTVVTFNQAGQLTPLGFDVAIIC